MPEWKIKYANGWDVYSRERGEDWGWERTFPTFEAAAKWLYDECGYSVEVIAF